MDPWTRFAETIFRINGLLMQAGESITGPIGQSSARWQVLGRLAYGAKTVAEMARDMGHARQSVQRVADILEKEGLIAYRAKPTDRRTSLLELTPKGFDVLKAIYSRQVAWSERVTNKLSPQNLEEATENLQQIAGIVEAIAKEDGDET